MAERIQTLGHTPEHKYSSYQKDAKVKESTEVADGIQDVRDTLESLKITIQLQREILALAGDAGDEGTSALMSDNIRAQEKLVWMYSAYLQ